MNRIKTTTYRLILLVLTVFLIASCKSDLDKANKYFSSYDYGDAIEYYEKAIIEEPDDLEISLRLAMCYLFVGESEKAEMLIKEKRLLDFGYKKQIGDAYYRASRRRLLRNDFDTGIAFLEKGLLYNESGSDENFASLFKLSKMSLSSNFDRANKGGIKRTKEQKAKVFLVVYNYTDEFDKQIVNRFFEVGHKEFFSYNNPDYAEFYLDKSISLDSSMRIKGAAVYYKWGEELMKRGESKDKYEYYFEKALKLDPL